VRDQVMGKVLRERPPSNRIVTQVLVATTARTCDRFDVQKQPDTSSWLLVYFADVRRHRIYLAPAVLSGRESLLVVICITDEG